MNPAPGRQPARPPTAMNTHRPILILLAAALPAAAAPFVQPAASNAGMRDVVTHDELAARIAREDRERAARPAPPAAPPAATATREEWKPVDLLQRSEFLSCNGVGTLVPKGSVLNVPAGYKARMQIADGNRIVPWAEFFRANRGWITTHEVSRKQAEADEPLSPETLEAIAQNPRVVVATLSGGPITVLRKPPATTTAPAAAAAPADATAPPADAAAAAPAGAAKPNPLTHPTP